MAKVKGSPKKKDPTHERNTVEASTSKGESTKKSKPSKKDSLQTVDTDSNDIDSGISSPEHTNQKTKNKNTSSASTISKISKKSKSSIPSKATNSKWQPKRASDISWLEGILQKDISTVRRKIHSTSGIEVRYPKSLSLRIEDGVEYVTYPWNNGKCSGYAKIEPGNKKAPKIPTSTMKFTILIGKIHLLTGKESTEYTGGAIISIPKGVKYGLHNKSEETCIMRFQTLTTDD